MALCEVLHHASMIARFGPSGGADKPAPVPVMVTQYNAWLRSALQYLFQNGMNRNAIKYLEFTPMALGSKTLLWFDEPFSAWEQCAEPKLPNGLTVTNAKWYRMAGAATWIAISAQSPSEDEHPERPALWDEKYLMLSKIDGPPDEYVSWFGGPIGKGDYRWWHPGGTKPYAVNFAGSATREPAVRLHNEMAAFDLIFSVEEHSVTEARERNDVTNLVWAIIRAELNRARLMETLKWVVQLPTQKGAHRAVVAIHGQTSAPHGCAMNWNGVSNPSMS